MPVPQPPPPPAARFLGAVFGAVFGGIGITVIGFLWTERGFGAPPLFFKIFGSFIALAFIAMGATFLIGAIKRTRAQSGPAAGDLRSSAGTAGNGYTCPACGARLGEAADVSPKGDVKCGYCRQWFNIHG